MGNSLAASSSNPPLDGGIPSSQRVCGEFRRQQMRRSIPRALWMVTILLALSTWLLVGSPAASAQSIFANLSGTVTDSTGAAVAGAKVEVVGEATKVARTQVTNSTGFFSLTELPRVPIASRSRPRASRGGLARGSCFRARTRSPSTLP